MKCFLKFGVIACAVLIAFSGLYLHSLSMMGVSSTFAQETDHEDDGDHDHISSSSTTFKGTIYHVTQPGFPTSSERIVEVNTTPPGPWVLSGSWKLKVDQAAGIVERFEANLNMARIAEPLAPLLGGGGVRNWHAMQITVETGTVVNDNGESLTVDGFATVAANGSERFTAEPVEIILTGGGTLNPAFIQIWFDTDPMTITSTQFIEGSPGPRNARAHFGGVILGAVDREK